jgi:hypothetical protein
MTRKIALDFMIDQILMQITINREKEIGCCERATAMVSSAKHTSTSSVIKK